MIRCMKPPPGWRCTLMAGHPGPCPTVRVSEVNVVSIIVAVLLAGLAVALGLATIVKIIPAIFSPWGN